MPMHEVVLHYEEAEADQTKVRAESEEEISVEEAVQKGGSGGSEKNGGSGGSKGKNPSITTSIEPRKNSAPSSEGITGQPISSLQRAIRNTIIGGVKTSISRHSDSDHDA